MGKIAISSHFLFRAVAPDEFIRASYLKLMDPKHRPRTLQPCSMKASSECGVEGCELVGGEVLLLLLRLLLQHAFSRSRRIGFTKPSKHTSCKSSWNEHDQGHDKAREVEDVGQRDPYGPQVKGATHLTS